MNWNRSIQINAPIDIINHVLNDESYLKEIKPKVVSSTLISSNGQVKVYDEVYQEGKRQERYELTLTINEDQDDYKKQTFEFTIANMIHVIGYFELVKENDNTTRFTYSGQNSGVSFMGKVMMKIASLFSNDKEAIEFLEAVKVVSEREGNK